MINWLIFKIFFVMDTKIRLELLGWFYLLYYSDIFIFFTMHATCVKICEYFFNCLTKFISLSYMHKKIDSFTHVDLNIYIRLYSCSLRSQTSNVNIIQNIIFSIRRNWISFEPDIESEGKGGKKNHTFFRRPFSVAMAISGAWACR